MEFFGARARNQKPETRNQKPETRNQKPETRNQKPIMNQHCATLSRVFAHILPYFIFGIAFLPPVLFMGLFAGLLVSCKTEAEVWKIGFIGPMSGDYANYGKLQMQGIELAIQEFEETYGQIGGRAIQLIAKDSAAQGEIAAKAASELLEQERITGLVGPAFSAEALAVAGAFQSAQTPMISVATNPKITQKGNYIFRTMANDGMVAGILASNLSQEFALPSLAILHTAQNAFSQTLAEGVARFYKELGGQVLANIGTRAGTTDFSSYLEELAQLAPAAIFLPFYAVEFGYILPQLRADPRYQNTLIIGADTIINQDFLDAAGDMANGIIAAADAPVFSERTHYFEAMYKVKFGVKPDIYATYMYDNATILLQAMRRVYRMQQNIGAAALQAEILYTTYTGAVGKIAFDANGDAKRNVAIFKVRANSFEKQATYAFHYGKMRRVE